MPTTPNIFSNVKLSRPSVLKSIDFTASQKEKRQKKQKEKEDEEEKRRQTKLASDIEKKKLKEQNAKDATELERKIQLGKKAKEKSDNEQKATIEAYWKEQKSKEDKLAACPVYQANMEQRRQGREENAKWQAAREEKEGNDAAYSKNQSRIMQENRSNYGW
jgi:hypothetical protein